MFKLASLPLPSSMAVSYLKNKEAAQKLLKIEPQEGQKAFYLVCCDMNLNPIV
jgi:hypothetical protein